MHVLPVIAEFLSAYPEVDVRLVQGDRVLHLLDDHVDLAVRIGELPDSRLTATRLGATRRVVCASPAYLSAHGVPDAPARLGEHACISFEAISAAEAWRFSVDGFEVNVPVRSRLVVNTAEAAIDAAVAGAGVTRVLCYQTGAAERDGRLQRVLREFEPAPLPISLVHMGQRRLPLKLRAFMDFTAPRLRDRLAN
jgi:DNA-binding transcriptional LysR family regulator